MKLQATSFGELNFGKAKLGDARRTRRLVQTANMMQRRPGGSLPQKLYWAGLLGQPLFVRRRISIKAAGQIGGECVEIPVSCAGCIGFRSARKWWFL